jgi:manganese transport system permease protein
VSGVIDWFVEPLSFDFMRRALLVAIVIGIACAILSCWLVLVGWSLLGDAVSHSVLPGVVLSYVLGIPLTIGAFVFGAGSVGLIALVRRTSRVKEDAAIGIVFTGLFALGLVLVSAIPSQTDLFHILFGNVLGVSDADIIQVCVIGAITTAVLLTFRRSFTLYAFDRTHAHAIGISPRVLEITLLGLLALTVVIALQAVGIVLVIAMLITPGTTAYLLTDRFDRMLMIAVGVGVGSCIVGTYLSFHLDVSTGGGIVCAVSAAFALAYLFSPAHGVIGKRLWGRRADGAIAEPVEA